MRRPLSRPRSGGSFKSTGDYRSAFPGAICSRHRIARDKPWEGCSNNASTPLEHFDSAFTLLNNFQEEVGPINNEGFRVRRRSLKYEDAIMPERTNIEFGLVKGKRACKPPTYKWSPPPMIFATRVVTSALPASSIRKVGW
ncbi:hypothetical protein EVAR_95230_1 [Eumeta japonica]|uniref:Uncharacterized protein n=1 Tax=Eumeta variegata TaxID=151549 RepID=A0A4C1SF20_EUMVA|nr:hypothetical protein EVAR_95230_1 [Eumeta japonica]